MRLLMVLSFATRGVWELYLEGRALTERRCVASAFTGSLSWLSARRRSCVESSRAAGPIVRRHGKLPPGDM